MKGLILSVVPDARIVDISHDITPQCIPEGAYVLRTACPWFRTDGPSIHVCVVDPTVGSDRKPLCVVTRDAVFIGPDNGVLHPAARLSGVNEIFEITHPDIFSENISSVFHGRDVFAPAAAMILDGSSPSSMDPPLPTMVELDIFASDVCEGDGEVRIMARVLHVDRFGNIVTSLGKEVFEGALRHHPVDRMTVRSGDHIRDVSFRNAYCGVPHGSFLLTGSSSGQIEIAKRNGNASKELGSGSDISFGEIEIVISRQS